MAASPHPPRITGADVNVAVTRAARSMRTASGALLADLGLHPGQDTLLLEVGRHDGISQAALADELGVEPPTVTKMVQRLEAAGIVRRRADADDRRRIRVYLTAKGKRLTPRVEAVRSDLGKRASRGLTRADRATLADLLSKLSANLDD